MSILADLSSITDQTGKSLVIRCIIIVSDRLVEEINALDTNWYEAWKPHLQATWKMIAGCKPFPTLDEITKINAEVILRTISAPSHVGYLTTCRHRWSRPLLRRRAWSWSERSDSLLRVKSLIIDDCSRTLMLI